MGFFSGTHLEFLAWKDIFGRLTPMLPSILYPHPHHSPFCSGPCMASSCCWKFSTGYAYQQRCSGFSLRAAQSYFHSAPMSGNVTGKTWLLIDLWAEPRHSEASRPFPCPWNGVPLAFFSPGGCSKDTDLWWCAVLRIHLNPGEASLCTVKILLPSRQASSVGSLCLLKLLPTTWSGLFLGSLPALCVEGLVSDHTWEAPWRVVNQQTAESKSLA